LRARIRLLMLRIVDERRLPFAVEAPNAETREAMAELEAGEGKRVSTVAELLDNLRAGHGGIGLNS
jgi:DNA-damage-inducible protein J